MHFLVIPKQRGRLTQLSKGNEQDEQLVGHLMMVASKVAKQGKIHPFQSTNPRCTHGAGQWHTREASTKHILLLGLR